MMDLKEERPAYVRFEIQQEEDRAATLANGYYTTRDVEVALITPPYSKDCNEKKVADWLKELDDNVRAGRLPLKWAEGYKAHYRAWKSGQEPPLDGVPIKGWSMLSPAQQQNLLQIGVKTVEDLAQMNDEGMKRYGMGALDLKTKAAAWLKTARDIGPITQENAALKVRVEEQDRKIADLTEMVKELQAKSRGKDKVSA